MNNMWAELTAQALILPDAEADRLIAFVGKMIPFLVPILATEPDPSVSAQLQSDLLDESRNPPTRDNGEMWSPAIESWLQENHLAFTRLGDKMVLLPRGMQMIAIQIVATDQALGNISYRMLEKSGRRNNS